MRSLRQALFLVSKVVYMKYHSFLLNSVSLLVRPFFPSADGQGACGWEHESNLTNQTLWDGSDQTVHNGSTLNSDEVPSLAWPFIICSGIHILPAMGFLMMGKGT